MAERGGWRAVVAPGLAALRCHWPQFVLFQAMLLGLVVGYYSSDVMRRWCEVVSSAKQQWGLWFAAVSTVIAGFFLPEAAKRLLRSGHLVTAGEAPSTIVIFAVGGIIVDLQYRALAALIGQTASPVTAVSKMLLDQFVLTPLYGAPYWLMAFALRGNNYRLGTTLRMISGKWYYHSVLPLLVPCWFFWIPMTLMIFSLPVSLQFGLYALAMAAWSLILVFITKREAPVCVEGSY